MTISKAYMLVAANAAAGATLTTATFDSTGYTHIVVFTRHDTHSGAAVPSDNKSTTGWCRPMQRQNNANSEWTQFHWAKIGTPGTGHTVTMTTDATATERGVVVWLINATSGDISVADSLGAIGNGTTMTGGNLYNRNAASVVSFSVFSVITSGTLTEGSGWTNDYETASIQVMSRGAETTTPIAVSATTTVSTDWSCLGISFREGLLLHKSYAVSAANAGAGTTLTTAAFDSTGYTHIVVAGRHTDDATPATVSDNKSGPGWNTSAPVQALANAMWLRLWWAKIGTPGSGHTVTMTTGGSAQNRRFSVWLVNCTTGKMSLVDYNQSTGTGNGVISIGQLLNSRRNLVVSFSQFCEWNSSTLTEGAGWTNDMESTSGQWQSRGAETTDVIPVETTITLLDPWAAVFASFGDGDNSYRVTRAHDVFQTTIDTTKWLNGHAGWGTGVWETGGLLSAEGSVPCAIIYTDLTWERAQWSKTVIKTLDGSVNSAQLGAIVLASTDPENESSYYGWLSNYSVGGSRYGIKETDWLMGQTDLALAGDRSTPAAAENDYVVMESDGLGNLNLYANESNVGSNVETLRLTLNDTTLTSGRPGMQLYEGNANNCRAQSWGAGDFARNPDVYSLDFGGGNGEDDRQKYYSFSLPQLPNGDFALGIAVIPSPLASTPHASNPSIFNNDVSFGYGVEGSIRLTHYESGGVTELYADMWATGDTGYEFLQAQTNSSGEIFIPRPETHFIVLQRSGAQLQLYVVRQGKTCTGPQGTAVAHSNTFPAATWYVGGWEANWAMGEFFCFTNAALTVNEINAWAVGRRITEVKANPHTYFPFRNGWVANETNLGTAGGSATLGGHAGSRHLARSLFDLNSRNYGYSPDHVRVNTGLRR